MHGNYLEKNPEDADNCVCLDALLFMRLYQGACHNSGGSTALAKVGYDGFVEFFGSKRAVFIDNIDDLAEGSLKIFSDLLISRWSRSLVVYTFRDRESGRAAEVRKALGGPMCNLLLHPPSSDIAKKQLIIEKVKNKVVECIPIEISGEYTDLPKLVANRLAKDLSLGDEFDIDSFIFSITRGLDLNQQEEYCSLNSVAQTRMFDVPKSPSQEIEIPEEIRDADYEFPLVYFGAKVYKVGTILDSLIEANIHHKAKPEKVRKVATKKAGGTKKSSGKQAGTALKRGGKKMKSLGGVVESGIDDGSIFIENFTEEFL
jgi:hypothetical protein